MNNKKTISLLLMALLIMCLGTVSFAVVQSSVFDKVTAGETSGHVHTYEDNMILGENCQVTIEKKCTICNYVASTEVIYQHTWVKQTDGREKCSSCGQFKSCGGYSQHKWQLKHDENRHWDECSVCHEKTAFENHSYSDSYRLSDNEYYHTQECSKCHYEKQTLHTYTPGWYTKSYDNESHYYECSVCKLKFGEVMHGDDSYTDYDMKSNESYHWKVCNVCKAEYDKESHDKKVASQIEGNDSHHDTVCSVCGIKTGTEVHKWSGIESDEHKCQECGYVPQGKNRYHYYDIGNGETINRLSYECQFCKATNTLKLNQAIDKLNIQEYTCSDAEKKMEDPPEFSRGTYTATWAGALRNRNGEIASGIKVPNEWITIYGWTQRTVDTHRKKTPEYKSETVTNLMNGIFGNSYQAPASAVKGVTELLGAENNNFITNDVIGLVDNTSQDWWIGFQGACPEVIKDGSTYKANQSYSGNTFSFTFNHGKGGWMFVNSRLFNSTGEGTNAVLFKSGSYEKEAPKPMYADVYYCYRTTDGEIPKNGYEAIYKHSSQVIYNNGRKTATVSVKPDLTKIDNTGYRYVGNKSSVGSTSTVSVAKYSPDVNTDETANVTVSFDNQHSAAIITFFIEPVKLYYGHVSTDYKGRLQNINAPTATNEAGLEFPDYYNGTNCAIDVKSLNKFYWPGFILEDAKTFQYAGNSTISSYASSKTIWEKHYNADETTIYEPGKTGNRYTVTTSVPSRYTTSKEKEGKAVDKQFYYYYNTPTLKIEHKDYDDNTMLKDKKDQDLTYLTQILNQYAMLNSLVTDNIGSNGTTVHELIVDDLESETIKHFSYNFGNRDLVQVEIYEIDSSGRESLYGVLYHEDEYKPKNKGYKVEDYAGVFEKYYTDSLSNIVGQIGQTDKTFNTNKNWRIVFKYRPVERVYISFMDLKGNKIFIRDDKNPGKYIAEITDKIDKVIGYTHTVTDLGTSGDYKAVGYTEDTNAYIRDYSKSNSTSNGSDILVPAQTGDRYIVIFYSTEKTVRVEYKDKKGNTIKDPTTLEVPDTGTTVDVPVIDLFDVVDYKKNENYDGNDATTEKQPSVPLTENDKTISVPSTGNNQHIIIYYEQNETLKVEYREIGTEQQLPVPPKYETTTFIEIPETGTKIEVPEVPGYVIKYYKHNDNYNGTDTTIDGPERTPGSQIPANPNGNNQYIIIYYEKNKETSKLIIECREDTPTGKELKDPTEVDIPVGEETKIIPPDIEGYTPTEWVDPDGSTNNDIEKIIVVGEPDGVKKIIIIYKKSDNDPGKTDPNPQPGVITPDDNKQRVVLRANTKGAEEYDVSSAIPTSEDLYTEGDVYSYRFVTDMTEAPYSEKIKVRIKQKYYTNIDDTSKISDVSTDIIEVEIKYNYYDIKKAELYDLKQMTIINDAIKNYNGYDYDAGTSGAYEEGKATLGVTKNIPKIYYEVPTGVGTEPTNRIQIRSNAGYEVKKNGDVYEITLQDIAYVKPNVSEFKSMYKLEADGIVEKCTFVRVQKLAIQMNGAEDVEILTGEQYNLPKKSEALRDVKYYIPYTPGRAPLYSFYRNKDLFVQEKALNQTYSTNFEGDYRLIEAVVDNNTTIQKFEPRNGTKLNVEKFIINSLNVNTPIINNTTLKPEEDNTNSTQLANGVTISNNVARYNNSSIILNLDKKFTITIPNAGNHISSKGYGNRNYNVDGTKANDLAGTINADRMKRNYEDMITEDYQKKYNVETEENSYGPTFAEMKLIKFPYDVYLLNPDKGDTTRQQKGAPQLFKAGEWYNLYDYIKPSVTTYTFVLPIWVKDAHDYKVSNGEGIYTLVVAENCPADKLQAAMNNPASVKKNARNEKADYILGKTFDTYVSGRVYDLEVRDSDDPGYMNKVPALKCNNLPLAQAGQVKAYKLGLKLGYRFYFDLKTKGISNNTIGLKPKIYYVPLTGGTATDDIALFYHSKTNLYNKLTEKDLYVNMMMAQTHGNVNNAQFTSETIYAKALNTSRVFTNRNTIGKLINGLVLKNATEKLPYDNVKEEMSVCGFAELGLDAFLASAGQSATINGNQHNIRNASGHWYGEYYLPASTLVYKGTTTTRENAMASKNILAGGYLIVAFEEITTGTNGTGKGYLTYSAPTTNTQWQKEEAHQSVKLPNGRTATVPTAGTPMAIYQIGLKANSDYETEGTH